MKYAEEKSFGSLDKKDYGYEITVSSGDAKYEVNSLNVLRVTGGAEASVITVTYTPKDVIYMTSITIMANCGSSGPRIISRSTVLNC